MKKRSNYLILTVLAFALSIVLFAFVGCNNNGAKGELAVVEKDPPPDVQPYKDFDMTSAFEVQEGVSYAYEGYYENSKGIRKSLNFNGSVFNVGVSNVDVVFVTVTATLGEKSVSKDISLSVKGTPDAVDKGFYDSDNDGSITKNLNYNPNYVKSGDSSVKVDFLGYYNQNEYGTQFSYLLGRLCTVEGGIYDGDYFSIYKESDQDKAWEDAVLSFWIYYAESPSGHDDASLEVGYFLKWHKDEPLPDGVRNYAEFGQSPITQCKKGEWTQVAIRFRDFYKLTPLFLNFERYKNGYSSDEEANEIFDTVAFKCRLGDEGLIPESETDELVKYTYSFYFDDVDILTYDDFAAAYPDYDFGEGSGEIAPAIIPGQTVSNAFSIENWSEGAKGLSFVYTIADENATHGKNEFAIYEQLPEAWHRLTELIELDVDNKTASAGRITDLGGGRFRYELMFSDAQANVSLGEETDGTETADVLYFFVYNTILETSEFAQISAYSE